MAKITSSATKELKAFVKYDEGKRRWDLLPFDAINEILKCLEFGATKYSDNNWCKGTEWSRYFSAAMRHMTAWWMGESEDPETGYTHLAHAGACIIFLIAHEKRGIGTDNRWNKGE